MRRSDAGSMMMTAATQQRIAAITRVMEKGGTMT